MSGVKGVSAESVEVLEVFTATLAVGRESFAGRGTPPSQAMSRYALDLGIYDTARTAGKDHEDAMELFTKRDDRPHVQGFLERSFSIADAATERGVDRQTLAREIGNQVIELFLIAVRTRNELPPGVSAPDLSDGVWERSVEQYQQAVALGRAALES